jgi:hypothetical protein
MEQARKIIEGSMSPDVDLASEAAKDIVKANILVKTVAVQPLLQQDTAHKLAVKARQEISNLRTRMDYGTKSRKNQFSNNQF